MVKSCNARTMNLLSTSLFCRRYSLSLHMLVIDKACYCDLSRCIFMESNRKRGSWWHFLNYITLENWKLRCVSLINVELEHISLTRCVFRLSYFYLSRKAYQNAAERDIRWKTIFVRKGYIARVMVGSKEGWMSIWVFTKGHFHDLKRMTSFSRSQTYDFPIT
jgi:hypothetical protein